MQRQALTLFLLIAVFIACASCIDVNLPDLPSTRFYVGGSFSSMKQADGTVVSANNIAYYFDGQWSAFGNGTNGDVRVIHMDLCRNVYAGGEFTTVDGVTTGYVAKYNVLKEQWEALASAGTLFGSSGVVHDISTDCVNIPSLQKKECNCDVYIAGQFTMNLGNGVTARNVAAYTAESASWSSMNSIEEFTVADTAYAIHKRYQTGVKDATKFVWVGGNFGLKSFDLSAKTWATHTTGTVVVKSIEYVIVPLFWKIDEVIIAGQFNFACDGGTCVNVASYDRDAKKFKPIGSSSVPTGIINSVSVTGGDVYVGGSFTSQNANNIAVLKEDASAYTSVSSSATPVATPVLKMNVCGYSNPLCKRGSFVVAAEGTTVSTGYLAFYDAESSSFVPMGNSTTVNGNVYALESAISSANLSAKTGILFVIASLLVTLFM